jgi:hypothetical protein
LKRLATGEQSLVTLSGLSEALRSA